MSETQAPPYAGETEPPTDGMQLYQCFYPAVLSGPPLVDEIVDELSRSQSEVQQSTVDMVAVSAVCDPAEAARLCLAIGAKLSQEGRDAALAAEYPFIIRELRWALPDDVPQNDPRFWPVDLHVITNQDDLARALTGHGASLSNERDFIASEITELEGLLSQTPEDQVIDRMSLEARLRGAREDAASLFPSNGEATTQHPLS